MTTETPSAQAIDEFGEDLDIVVSDILERFAHLGLPEGEQLSDLHVELADAMSGVLKVWI